MEEVAAYFGFIYHERQKRITEQKTDNKTNIKGVNNNIFNEILEEFFSNVGGAKKVVCSCATDNYRVGMDDRINIKRVDNEILEEFFNTGGAEKDKHIRHNNTNNFGFNFGIFD